MYGGYVKSVFIFHLVAINIETLQLHISNSVEGFTIEMQIFLSNIFKLSDSWWIGRDSSVGIATRYMVFGPGIDSR